MNNLTAKTENTVIASNAVNYTVYGYGSIKTRKGGKMERTCRICTQIKPIYAKELCKNCYSAEWKKRNPDTNSRYVKKHRENHPGYAADGLRRLEQFKEKSLLKYWKMLELIPHLCADNWKNIENRNARIYRSHSHAPDFNREFV